MPFACAPGSIYNSFRADMSLIPSAPQSVNSRLVSSSLGHLNYHFDTLEIPVQVNFDVTSHILTWRYPDEERRGIKLKSINPD